MLIYAHLCFTIGKEDGMMGHNQPHFSEETKMQDLYNVTFSNPFFPDTDMPVKSGRSLNLTGKQIGAMLDKYGLQYYSNFLSSGGADEWIAAKGAWSQQVNGWFITVRFMGAA